MKLLDRLLCGIVFGGLFGFAAPLAQAGPADDYVKGLVGKWRGGGTITVDAKGRKVRLRCVTNNTLNKATRTLTLKGRCATSDRTRSLRGKLKYDANGTKFTTVSLSVAGRSVGSYSSLKGTTLTLRGSARDPSTNKTVVGRTFVRRTGRNFLIQLQSKESAGWKTRGTLKFRR